MITMRKYVAGAATVVVGGVVALSGAAHAAEPGGLEIITRRHRGVPDGVGRRGDAAGRRPTARRRSRCWRRDARRGDRRAPLHRGSRGAAAPRHVGQHGRRPAREREGGSQRVPLACSRPRSGPAWSRTVRRRRCSPRPPPIDRRHGAAIAPLVAGTDTALYDAVIFAGGQFTSDASRRALVLLTDGEDNVSRATIDEAAAVAAGLPVHVIELVTDRERPPGARPAGRRRRRHGHDGHRSGRADRPVPARRRHRRQPVPGQLHERRLGARRPHRPGSRRDGHAQPPRRPSGCPLRRPPRRRHRPTTTAPTPATTPPTPAAAAPRVRPLAEAAPHDEALERRAPDRRRARSSSSMLITTALVLRRDGGRRAMIRSGLGLERARDAGTGVVKLKERTTAGVDRFLERRGRSRSASSALEAAGISLRPGEFVMLVLTATAVGALAMLALFGPLALLATIVLGPLTAKIVLDRRCASRRAKFAEQLAGNLQLLTSSLKSGYGLLPALDNVAQEAEEPSKSEFRRALLEIRVGRDVSEALAALGARMASKDFEWVVGAIDINREVGGDLALDPRQRRRDHPRTPAARSPRQRPHRRGSPVGLRADRPPGVRWPRDVRDQSRLSRAAVLRRRASCCSPSAPGCSSPDGCG